MAKELIYKVRIDYDASSAVSGADRIEDSQKEARFSIKKTEDAFESLFQAQRRNQAATSNFNKNQSRANQVLFNFGDIANDAQQFSFGFSNGLRAIGNNIGFAAEGLANLNTKSGGFRGTLKTLTSSLLGPGGLILGINLAVTAFTVFGDKLFDTDKQVDKLRENIKDTSDFFENLAGDAVDDFVEQAESIDEQIGIISDALNSLFLEEAGLDQLPTPALRLNTALQDATNTINSGLNPAQRNTIKNLSQEELLQLSVSKEVRDILINKKAELEAQKLINRFAKEQLDTVKQLSTFSFEAQGRLQAIGESLRTQDIAMGITTEFVGGGEAERRRQQIEQQQKQQQQAEQRAQEALQRIEGRTAKTLGSIDQLALRGVEAGESIQEGFGEVGDVIARAGAQAIITANNIQQAGRAIINTVISEIVAYAIRSAIRDLPFPANIAAASGAAIAGRALADLIPDPSSDNLSSGGGGGRTGGVISGRPGGPVRTSQGPRGSNVRGISQSSNQPNITLNVQNRIDERGLLLKVRQGENKLGSQQVTVNND